MSVPTPLNFDTEIIDDGTTLLINHHRPEGTHKIVVSWNTREECEANWNAALALWLRGGLGNYRMEPGQANVVRRLGRRWYVTVLSGPPTWWWPHVSIRRRKVMVGWLRRGYVLSRASR